jgi:diaminopimelate epimerase
MKKIKFTKMVASGNDFVIMEARPPGNTRGLAKMVSDRRFGIGADGLLVLEKSRKADMRMKIFNADGSEAQMCGNGARCAALYLGKKRSRLETAAGTIECEINQDNVRIKLTDPKGIKLDVPIKAYGRNLKINLINTGVPHAVIFVEGLDEIHVSSIGRRIRYHKRFAFEGTNVDFVEVLGKDNISLRTYERGVEDETLACGTGAVASAIIFALKSHTPNKVSVMTRGGEPLMVYFRIRGRDFTDVWLEGKAKIVCRGEYYV